MPRGNVPSMVALTRLGARKASETVMLTERTLQRSRIAISTVSVTSPAIISLSAPPAALIEDVGRTDINVSGRAMSAGVALIAVSANRFYLRGESLRLKLILYHQLQD